MTPFNTADLSELFDDTIEINNVVGNTASQNPTTATHQITKIIQPEAAELRAGFVANDRHEIRDGIADVLFTLAGLYGRMGLDRRDLEVDFEVGLQDHDLLGPLEPAGYLDKIDQCLQALLIVLETEADYNYNVFTALADAAVQWTLRLASALNIDAVADLRAVVASNWTKFDNTIEQAIATRDKYAAIGVETYYIRTQRDGADDRELYVTFSSHDQTGTDNKSYPKGKWLKSVNFKDTNFNDVPVEAAAVDG